MIVRELLVLLAFALLCPPAAWAQNVDVVVDGQQVSFPLQQPTIDHGRVLIPLRNVFEQMGATVMWEASTRTVRAARGNTLVVLEIGSRTAQVDGVRHDLDVPPRVLNGRTLIPFRFVSEALGATVHWDDSAKLVTVHPGGENLSKEPSARTYTGVVVEMQPSIYMQGTHRLEDQDGNLVVLLSDQRSDVNLDQYVGQRVKVRGPSEATVEGDQSIVYVEEVETAGR